MAVAPAPLFTPPYPPPVYPLKMTIRARIMRMIRERLALITIANGFETDIGVNLWAGQPTTPEPFVIPMTYYWDAFETGSPRIGSNVNSVQVQLWTYTKIPTPDEALSEIDREVLAAQQMPIVCDQHLADLKVGLVRDAKTGQYDAKFGGLAHGFRFADAEYFYGIQPDLLFCGSITQWALDYQHALGDPYNLTRS